MRRECDERELDDQLVRRIGAEYIEMPALQLTIEQTRRLWWAIPTRLARGQRSDQTLLGIYAMLSLFSRWYRSSAQSVFAYSSQQLRTAVAFAPALRDLTTHGSEASVASPKSC
jgi:hypothetical protein